VLGRPSPRARHEVMAHHLVVTQNTTVDGRIEFLDDWFDPSPPDQDVADLQEEMDRQGGSTAAM
jgi:hypothetical protein